MNEEQDALDPRRQRRRTPAILLGLLPAAIATTILVAGPSYAAPAAISADAGTAVSRASLITPGVIAPLTAVNLKAGVQKIIVTVPKPKVIAPAAIAVSVDTATSHTAYAKVASSTIRTSLSYKQFCANPSNPVTTSGTTGKALLSTVNGERAKLGIKPLAWSSSMASIATSWSKSMLAKDVKTAKLIDGLAHNPNRPGAENVAVVYRSTGYTASAAITKMHGNLVYSPGHCLNLMNPTYKSMGSGVAHSSNDRVWYATENFR